MLIFDEAVVSLDGQSAEYVARTVDYVWGKVTVLFITHKVQGTQGQLVDRHLRLGR